MLPLPPPLQAAINHLLGQASWAREKLMPFAGHAAQIKLPPFEAAFLITPDGSIAAPPDDAELEVAISLPAATPLLALQGKDAVMRAARIEGSAEFAQALAFVIRNLRWDAEEDLSRLVGDVAAHRLVKGGKEFVAWQQQAAQNFAANFAEFFTEEQPLIAKQADIAAFSADIDRLRDDVARLEKRIQVLT
ncbi:MAG: SCP2 sterol-binding domain-containing protein [Rhodocyclales bacterium]|nr:SCP2 sterol-binding domain-containing protein [Rhodocyclales bacterium]